MTRRIAMISVHACPLAKLGGRDSGGMNVYVRELARDLGARGIEVDVFTRWREQYDPRIQQLGPNARVIHIQSGPIGYWPKMDVYEHLDEFTAKLLEHAASEGKPYDLVHAHYWLSAKVARTLEQTWNVPVIQMFHTLGLVKREVMDEDIDGESDIRIEIEREAVKKSAAVVAASEIELGELRRLYRADASRVAVIPCGVDPTLFHPVRQVDAREKLGRDQCERLILFVGRIEQIKGIDVLLRALGLLFQRHPDMRCDGGGPDRRPPPHAPGSRRARPRGTLHLAPRRGPHRGSVRPRARRTQGERIGGDLIRHPKAGDGDLRSPGRRRLRVFGHACIVDPHRGHARDLLRDHERPEGNARSENDAGTDG